MRLANQARSVVFLGPVLVASVGACTAILGLQPAELVGTGGGGTGGPTTTATVDVSTSASSTTSSASSTTSSASSTSSSSSSGSSGSAAILSGLSSPNSLAVDGWGFYWADDDGTVMQADFATLTQSPLASMRTGPQGLVISPGAGTSPSVLYWVEPTPGNVMSVVTQHLPAQPTSVGVVQAPAAVAVAESGIAFWTAMGGSWSWIPGMTPQQVRTYDGPGGKIAAMLGGSASCQLLVYSSNDANGGLAVQPFGGCTTDQGDFLTTSAVAAVTTDTMFAYWTDGATDGSVTRAPVPIGGSGFTVIAPSQPHPVDIAVDGTNVYWINQGASANAGAVMRAPLAGGVTPVPLASGQMLPRGLFVTTDAVYWLSGATGDGVVNKLLK